MTFAALVFYPINTLSSAIYKAEARKLVHLWFNVKGKLLFSVLKRLQICNLTSWNTFLSWLYENGRDIVKLLFKS